MILEVCVLPILKKKAVQRSLFLSPTITHETFFGSVRLSEQGVRFQHKSM